MRVTFKNPYDKEWEASLTIPWMGAIAFPIRTFRLVRALRKISQLPPERAEQAVLRVADEFEARGFNVTREETRPS